MPSALVADLIDVLDKLAGGVHTGSRPVHAKGTMYAGTFTPVPGRRGSTLLLPRRWACLTPGAPTRRRAYRVTRYLTSSMTLSEWLLNSGAYMHWMSASPVGYLPLSCTRTEYSNTYVPFGR